MGLRPFIIGLGAAGFIAATVLPAAAQLDDFLCSTFNMKCNRPPPPPPVAPVPDPAPEAPVKAKHHAHKAKPKRTPAPTTESPAPAAAPDAAPK